MKGDARGKARLGDLWRRNESYFDVVWAWNQMHDRFEMRVCQSAGMRRGEKPVTGKDCAGNELLW